MTERFVAYYRVSTRAQGASGLGIDAQKGAISRYLGAGIANIVADYTEVESGRRSDRPALERALASARVHQAALVVAKVDRLTRSVAFLSRLLEAGVDVRFADLPAIEGPTGRFMLQQMAAVAELEAGLISSRTKAALAAAKARGQRLGGDKGARLSSDAMAAGRASQSKQAMLRALDLAPLLSELERSGSMTAKELANALTSRRIPTARGRSAWSDVQIMRIKRRIATMESDDNTLKSKR